MNWWNKLATVFFIMTPGILGSICVLRAESFEAYVQVSKDYARWWLFLPIGGYLLHAVVKG